MLSSTAQRLIHSLSEHSAHVGVIGLGYVGLPLSLAFHRAGFHVTGFDVDRKKIACLRGGHSFIRHIGERRVAEARASGRFEATDRFDALVDMDAIVICVPTPLDENREPDLTYIKHTGRTVAKWLRPGQLVVLESSTFPGTTEEILLPVLEASGTACRAGDSHTVVRRRRARLSVNGAPMTLSTANGTPTCAVLETAADDCAGASAPISGRAFVAYSPEREDPGNAKFTTRNIPKLVGGIDAESTAVACALYRAAFEKVIPVSSARVAEMAKILENTYRCVNIALVNELKQLSLRMGIDIWEVIDAAATKPFGFQPFYPGPGLGGHCIPIDPFYLSWKARQYDFSTRFIELAGEINVEMPYRVTENITHALNQRGKTVNGAHILVLGVAYKKDIDDLRESPALKIIGLLRKMGADVVYNDPYCPHVWRGRQNDFEMASVPFQPRDAARYDCVIIATDHSVYDYREIARHATLLIDTRNATRGINRPEVVRC